MNMLLLSYYLALGFSFRTLNIYHNEESCMELKEYGAFL